MPKKIYLGCEYVFQQAINCYHNNGSLRGALPSGTRIIFRNWSPDFNNIMFSLASQPNSIWGAIISGHRVYVRKVPVKKIDKQVAATLTGQKVYDKYKLSKTMSDAFKSDVKKTYDKFQAEFQKLDGSPIKKKPILMMPPLTNIKVTIAKEEPDEEFNRLSHIE